MNPKPVIVLPQAETDIDEAIDWYASIGGNALSDQWLLSVRSAMHRIAENPHIGSTRYALPLKLDELRFWAVTGFPYLMFYVERESHIDVSRVLHGKRDIPAWMGAN